MSPLRVSDAYDKRLDIETSTDMYFNGLAEAKYTGRGRLARIRKLY